MNIYDLTIEELNSYLLSKQIKKYRANQIWDWLYVKKVSNFKEMTNLSQDIIELLEKNFTITTLKQVTKVVSRDKTVKVLFALADKHLIETVVMKHDYGNSICVTTQVGCNIGCTFCASGQLKKKRDLTGGEIVAQVIEMEKIMKEKITSVVVMGIGEPFDNFINVKKFLEIINNQKGLNIGARRITVSTSGFVNRFDDFANIGIQANLAVSLHAPNNEIRNQLMPIINRRFPVETLMKAIDDYIKKTNRRVTIEYLLIKDLNDQVGHALDLAKLLKGKNVYVNLIPYNEVKESNYRRCSQLQMNIFYQTLAEQKIQVVLRREFGHDINAACGQLRSQHL